MSCAIGCRCGSDLALLWLWCRLVAEALIQALAWELPYAAGVALKSKNKTNKKTTPRVPVVSQWLTNPTRNPEVAGSIPGLAQRVKDLVSP